ncbi:MAG: PsbP-related protein [Anaerolineae bacterium]
MIQTPDSGTLYRIRTRHKDVGVAIVVLVALSLGWLLRQQVTTRTLLFQDANSPFRMAYPATWSEVESLQDVLLNVEDPQTDSTFKTTLTVESRALDPQSPPDLQTLVDRRIEQRGTLTAYQFFSEEETTADGVPAEQLEYAFVTQPIDIAGRASPPIVVHAREVIVLAKDWVYYITLNAPESEFVAASERFEQILQTLRVQ